MNVKNVLNSIELCMKKKDKIIVSIDGKSGSGKTTFAEFLSKEYDCNIFHMDDFFLPVNLKTKDRLEEVGGNVDYVRFKEEVLSRISEGEFRYQPYSCKTGMLGDYIKVTSRRLNIVEGVYSMHPTLIDSYDLKIFMSIDEKEQKRRILVRNGEVMYNRFINEWIPLENIYFNKMNIEEKCDIVLM